MTRMLYSERMNRLDRSVPNDAPAYSDATVAELGAAAFNMSYDAFCAALNEPAGNYAEDKYVQFKAIGRAMSAFSDSTLTVLANAYKESQS